MATLPYTLATAGIDVELLAIILSDYIEAIYLPDSYEDPIGYVAAMSRREDIGAFLKEIDKKTNHDTRPETAVFEGQRRTRKLKSAKKDRQG